jgi:hypothetical protein
MSNKKRERVKKKNSYGKKYLAIGIIAVFIFAFALNFVNVSQPSEQIPNTITGHSIIGDLFANWSGGNLDVNIAKYLFWIILTLFIFSALHFAKFPDNSFLQFLLGISISFLATAYITPAEVFTALTTYTALGLTLSVIAPFLVMIFFSAMLLSNEKISQMTIAKIMLEVMLWLFFVGFLIYKLITGYSGHELSRGMMIVMFVVLGLSGLILVFNKNFRKWVRGLGIEIMKAKSEMKRTVAEETKKFGDIVTPTAEEVEKYGR